MIVEALRGLNIDVSERVATRALVVSAALYLGTLLAFVLTPLNAVPDSLPVARDSGPYPMAGVIVSGFLIAYGCHVWVSSREALGRRRGNKAVEARYSVYAALGVSRLEVAVVETAVPVLLGGLGVGAIALKVALAADVVDSPLVFAGAALCLALGLEAVRSGVTGGGVHEIGSHRGFAGIMTSLAVTAMVVAGRAAPLSHERIPALDRVLWGGSVVLLVAVAYRTGRSLCAHHGDPVPAVVAATKWTRRGQRGIPAAPSVLIRTLLIDNVVRGAYASRWLLPLAVVVGMIDGLRAEVGWPLLFVGFMWVLRSLNGIAMDPLHLGVRGRVIREFGVHGWGISVAYAASGISRAVASCVLLPVIATQLGIGRVSDMIALLILCPIAARMATGIFVGLTWREPGPLRETLAASLEVVVLAALAAVARVAPLVTIGGAILLFVISCYVFEKRLLSR